jgi:protein-S-isoprenylcysteine O-methyltransferase Ste14
MALKNEIPRVGNHLFRWRSYVPLLFLPLVVPALLAKEGVGHNETIEFAWEAIGTLVAIAGLLVRALAVGHAPVNTSGRNTRRQKADVLNTTGLYSVVRHPVYLGNFLVWMGLVVYAQSIGAGLVTMLVYWLYYERIMAAEEEFLHMRFGAAFEHWSARTPAFIPALSGWKRAAFAFSWKSVLAREQSTWFGTMAAFFVFETVGELSGGESLDPVWLSALAIAVLVYLGLRGLKRLGILYVEGR